MRLQKALLYCGIASSLLYVCMNIFVPPFFEGYNTASQTVSELSAIDAPTRTLWFWLGLLYTFLAIAFGWGVKLSSAENGSLRLVSYLLLLYGMINLIWPFAPMHQREVLAAGGATFSDTLHIILAMIVVLVMLMAMWFGRSAFGKKFRIYTVLTIVALLVFGFLTGLDAPKVNVNQPTPLIGVWERINIGVFLLWVAVLAISTLQRRQQSAL